MKKKELYIMFGQVITLIAGSSLIDKVNMEKFKEFYDFVEESIDKYSN